MACTTPWRGLAPLGARWHGTPQWRPSAPPAAAAAAARRPAVAAAAAAGGQGSSSTADSVFGRLVAAGARPTKTAVGRLSVQELRDECAARGLPTEGLKPVLAERLLAWWTVHVDGAASAGNAGPAAAAPGPAAADGPGSEPAAAAPAAAAPAADEEAARAASGAPGSQAPLQQQQQLPQQPSAAAAAKIAAAATRDAAGAAAAAAGAPRVRVTWLGTSSGNPTPRRNVSAIAVRYGGDTLMVDCGEGTRNQMRRGGLDPGAVRAAFVTHMHGDHCFGVGGLIAAVCEARLGTPAQADPLLLFGPPELQSLVAYAIKSGSIALTTPVVVTGWVLDGRRARPPTPVDDAGMLRFALQGPDQAGQVPPAVAAGLQAAYDAGSENVVQPGLTWSVRLPGGAPLVAAAQLQHRVPCWGYVFQEPPAPVPPPPEAQAAAQAGQEAWVRRGRKLVILGDTCDSAAIAPLARGCDLLSHEATFCRGMEEKAELAQHSTTEQAGAFAAAVGARTLVLTHFSARYESVTGIAHSLKQQRRGAGGPPLRKGQAAAEALSRDAPRSEMMRLLEETQRAYRKDAIYLASDFYTFEVPPPAPMPADRLREEQAREAARPLPGAAPPRRPPRGPYMQQQQGGRFQPQQQRGRYPPQQQQQRRQYQQQP